MDRMAAKKQGQEALLVWCREKTQQHPAWLSQPVDDFGTSWRDGLAFAVLLFCVAPNTSRDFDLGQCRALAASEPKKLLSKVFEGAKNAGIPPLLDPDDLLGQDADSNTEAVVMYLSQFYRFEQARLQEQQRKTSARQSIQFTKPSSVSSRGGPSGVFVGPGDDSQRPRCVIWFSLSLLNSLLNSLGFTIARTF